MQYIALLRGVNISGKNKVTMSILKEELEKIGLEEVKTYLNSGNIIFISTLEKNILSKEIKNVIQKTFLINIPVFIMNYDALKDLLDHCPSWWGSDDKSIYDNVIFVIPPYTVSDAYKILKEPKKELEQTKEYKNNIFWSYKLKYYQKTNWWSKTATKELHDVITIRTANTVKKLLVLCQK